MKNNKGFSLVELIVVIAIMAILAAVAIPTFAGFITKANVAADVDFINNAEYAAELAYTADLSKEVSHVEVTLGANGAIDTVTVVFAAPTGGTAPASVPVEVDDKTSTDEAKNLIANTIDWEYAFKSQKTANTVWKLSGNGRALESASATNNG